jgi:hypothetical protein
MEIVLIYQFHKLIFLLALFSLQKYIFTPKNLTAAAFVACTEPIEEMPLYVNTEDAYLKSVVLWRLSIAK